MKIKIITAILGAVWLTLFLNGCASNSASSSNKESQAAEYNAKLGVEYLRQNRLELAENKLNKALSQSPNSVNANHYYALLQEKLGNNAKANKHFKRAIRNSSRDPELHNNYGSFLCHMEQYSQAISEFGQAVKDPLYKTPEFAYTNAGVCLRKSNSKEDIEPYFRKALSINPKFPSALYEMAKLNWDQGNASKAQAFLFRYQEVGRLNSEGLLLCKEINEKLGEMAEADKCVSKLLTDFPSSQEAGKISE